MTLLEWGIRGFGIESQRDFLSRRRGDWRRILSNVLISRIIITLVGILRLVVLGTHWSSGHKVFSHLDNVTVTVIIRNDESVDRMGPFFS